MDDFKIFLTNMLKLDAKERKEVDKRILARIAKDVKESQLSFNSFKNFIKENNITEYFPNLENHNNIIELYEDLTSVCELELSSTVLHNMLLMD